MPSGPGVFCEERSDAADRFTHRLDPRYPVDRHSDIEMVFQLGYEFQRLERIESQIGGQATVRFQFDGSSAYAAENGEHAPPNIVSIRRCHRTSHNR
jgi:hypothetical protein